MESYMETLMADADGPRRAMITILQQINDNLSQNFQQQNERLERLEKIAASVQQGGLATGARQPPLELDSVEANGQEQLEQPANPAIETQEPQSKDMMDSSSNAPQVNPEAIHPITQEGSVRDGDGPSGPYADYKDPKSSSAEAVVAQQTLEDKSQDTGSIHSAIKPGGQTNSLPKTSYLDASPTPFGRSAFFEKHPRVEAWLKENIWVPSDRRFPLAFDVDSLNSVSDLGMIKEIGSKLHKFNGGIISNLGRLVIIDNFNSGNNRVFGNDINDIPFSHCRPTDNYRHTWTIANGVLAEPEALKPLSELPVMEWDNHEDPPAAPWRRAIILEGVGEIVSKNIKDYHVIVDGLFRLGPAMTENPILTHLSKRQSFYARKETEKYGTAIQPTNSWVGKHVLHYSWFTLYPDNAVRSSRMRTKQDPSVTDFPHHCFLAGPLYGDPEHRWLGRTNTTIQLHYSILPYTSEFDRIRDYTILVIRPPTAIDIQTDTPYLAGQVSMIHHSAFVLESIAKHAKEIADYLEDMLAIGDNFLYDPTGHDKLLFDDDTFSSSRKYWWAMDMLSTIRPHIEECIRAHNNMYNDLIWPLKRIEPLPPGLSQADFRAGQAFSQLKDLLKRFSAQQTRVETLRSGVFNASGVVESRASTRFGEIVRLLTYVSIFYLPLSFSISLWQTTPFFAERSTGILFTVMAIVGFVTYFTTFNLDNIVHFCDKQYQAFKTYILRYMNEEGGVWANRAFMYSGFRPRTQNSTPSEWWVFWYAMTFLFRPSTWKEKLQKKPEQKGSHTRTMTWTSVVHPHSSKGFVIPEDGDDDAVWMSGFPSGEEKTSMAQARGVSIEGISIHDRISGL